MERPGGGMLGRLTERILGYVALALIALAAVALWRMGPEGRGALWEGAWRTALWLALAAALPWSARFFMGRILEVGANWAGAALIAALTGLDLGIGVFLMRGLPDSGWGWVVGLAALAVAGTYNYLVAEYLSERAGG